MRVISNRALRDFYTSHAQAEGPLRAWFSEAKNAEWTSPQDIKSRYAHASILPDNRVVFNIGGNKYRLICKIHYDRGIVYVRFVGTHAAYDQIDAETI